MKYREENGEFKSRSEVLKVPRIGAKAYEQCAGFLRVPDSGEILDNTGVHPESYETAKKLIKRLGYSEEEISAGTFGAIRLKADAVGIPSLAKELSCGEPTLADIIKELEKPGRDVRDSLPKPMLRDRVLDIADLKIGMKLTGTVRNVIDFGAFVDIGVHQDGLVHISQISEKFIKHPSDVLSVGDVVTVWVLNIDLKKKRIGLTMKENSLRE